MLRPYRNCWALFVLVMFILLPLELMAKEVGQFTEVQGNIELSGPRKPEPLRVKPQTGVELNDRIKTEAESRAQLQFLDASTMTIAPRSDVIIESYMFDGKKGEQSSLSKLTQGLVRLVVPVSKLEKKEFLVKTSTAIMGIRGTELYILIGPDFTDVFVKTGSVAVAPNKEGAGGGPRSSLAPEEQRLIERLARQAAVRAFPKLAVNPELVNPVVIGANECARSTMDGVGPVTPVPPGGFNTLNATLVSGLPPNNVLGLTSNPVAMLQTLQQLQPTAFTATGAGSPPGPPDSNTGTAGTGGGGGGGGVASPSQ